MNYEFDTYLAAYRLTPVAKRQDVRLGFLECISSVLQRKHDDFFLNYLGGSNEAVYSGATAYVRYDRVNYQNRIYECTNDTTGSLPTDRNYWVQVIADFRGSVERIRYNFQTIMLTWILNKWFGTTFNQPVTLTNSDIYIVGNLRDGDTFVVADESVVDGIFNTSYVSDVAAGAAGWVGEDPSYSFGPNFTVYYPVSLIPTTSDEKYFQLTSLVDKYKVFGSTVGYISY